MSPLSLREAEAAGASQRLKELFIMTTRRFVILAIVGWAVMATLSSVHARQTPNGPDGAIDGATRRQVIDGAIERLKTAYVFPEVAEKMAVALRERLDRKEYDGITSARTFVETLTRNLQEVSQDKHLRVLYSADPFPARPDAPSPEERARGLAEERRRNFGFERVERLEGNIGYIDLRDFSGSPEAGEAAVAAMNFLSGTDALIFDLRRNGGGSPAMIGIISSYLFDDVVHLNDFYWRESNETRQFWTSPHVAGHRYGGTKPVFVLTSARTFSAAEEFTYNLKNLKRATIVGETTGGGAHPGGVRRITDHFGIWVPAGRAINPITKTNWEGTGIEPDIKVDAPQALQTAHLEALKKVRETTTDARYREQLDRAIAAVQKSSSSESPR